MADYIVLIYAGCGIVCAGHYVANYGRAVAFDWPMLESLGIAVLWPIYAANLFFKRFR